jgi:hypothetical protein
LHKILYKDGYYGTFGNWRGKPLVNIETIVNLIGSTKTKKGFIIKTSVDTNEYKKGIKISDSEIEALTLERDAPKKIRQFWFLNIWRVVCTVFLNDTALKTLSLLPCLVI